MEKAIRNNIFKTTITLLLLAASRILLLADLSFDHDEVWSVWQTFGTPQEIIARTPFDWTPLYYLFIGFWRVIVGMHPFVLRMSSVLFFMLGLALVYHLSKKLFGDKQTAWLVMLAYAGLGYVVYLSVLLRAYAMVMMLTPLGLILVLRYFESPKIRTGIMLGITMATMFYITLSAVFGFLIMGVFSVFLYPSRVWRWWLPGLVAGIIALPEIRHKMGMVATRTAVELNLVLPPLPQAFAGIYQDYLGAGFWVWLGVIIIATIAILFDFFRRNSENIPPQGQGKPSPYSKARFSTTSIKVGGGENDKKLLQKIVFILLWITLSPILLYAIHSRTNFFGARYSWWIAIGIALWIGYGLSRLPRNFSTLAGIGLLVLVFFPQDITSYKERSPQFEQNFAWLSEHMQPGDVLMIDSECDCGRLEQWDYYMDVYFQNDVQLVNDVRDEYRRIWYVRTSGGENDETFSAVQNRRAPGAFSGDPEFFFQLYTLPPNTEGILFENGMRFHGYEVLDDDGIETAYILYPEGSEIRVRLWWSIDEPVTLEYSVGLQMFNHRTNEMIAQSDQAPIAIHLNPANSTPLPNSMLEWQPTIFHIEERTLAIPLGLRREDLTVYLTVYDWRDGSRFSAEGVTDDNLLPLFVVDVMAW